MNADAAAPAPREKDYADKEILDTYFPEDVNNIAGMCFKNSIRVFKAHSSQKVTICTNYPILRFLAVQALMDGIPVKQGLPENIQRIIFKFSCIHISWNQ